MADIGAAFRALHAPGDPFVIPNPWDMGSARMLAAMGFKALATTSAGYAFALGRPEGTLSFEEQVDHGGDLAGAIALPVSADLEKGAGDTPESAAETVRRAAAAGLAGCSLEDATGDPAAPIYDFALAVEKVAAAAEAARGLDRDFVFTARAENFLHRRPDLDDTLKRLEAFAAVGADALYAPGLPDLAAIEAACALGKPVNALMGGSGAMFTVAELAEAGVARISVGSAFARLAYGAVIRAATDIRDSGGFETLRAGASFREIEALLKP
ncbi:MAG: isocitrate lyase/phosphoenolpyruvate mutase family protein [Pseudomonadota bacterium]